MADAQIQRFVESQRELGQWGIAHRAAARVRPLDGHDAGEDVAGRALPAPRASRRTRSRSCRTAARRSSTCRTARDPGRFELLKRMREAAIGTGNAAAQIAGAGPISEALYREANPADGGAANTLDAVHPNWHLAGARTGDLVVTHERGRRVLRPDQPAGRQPRRAADARQLHGGDRARRRSSSRRVPPGERVARLRRHRAATRTSRRTSTSRRPSRGCSGCARRATAQGRVLGEALLSSGLPPVPGAADRRAGSCA